MDPFAHNLFDPFDPVGDDKSRQMAEQNFQRAMGPFWKLVFEGLLKLKPTDWKGFRCELDVQWNLETKQFHFTGRFRDGTSNRGKGIESHALLELIGSLHEAYRTYDERLEWKKVTLEHTWDPTVKKWCQKTVRDYGRSLFKPGQGDPKNIGLS